MAYVSDESGRFEVYIRRYPQGERLAVSTGGGLSPVWAPDGREVFFTGTYEGTLRLMVVAVTSDGDSLRLSTPRPVLDMRVAGPTGVIEQYAAGSNAGAGYDIFPDGQRFVMVRGADPQGTREIVLVQNFFEEVKRLAPAR
jgi:Tol biopolymer transport system component